MLNHKFTKIIATLGPACDSGEVIQQLIEAGVNIFRFNMKHGTVEWHKERVNLVLDIAKRLKKDIGILIDLQGPELRIDTLNHEDMEVKEDEEIFFTPSFIQNIRSICIPHHLVFDILEPGDKILIDDGSFEFEILTNQNHIIKAKVLEGGIIKDRKGVNLPGKKIKFSGLIKADLARLELAQKHPVDFIALSFSRTKEDLVVLRQEMDKRKIKAGVIAKIESQEAVENINELIEYADGIMVARGDLGIEMPIERLAFIQKEIVEKCRHRHKPVIIATQMLQSMIENPRPTRAEATDVANAVFDGTDAVMLSGETASGKYPVKAVKAMAKIVHYNEDKTDLMDICCETKSAVELIVHAVVSMLDNPDHPHVDKVIVFTETGTTARILASFHPRIPIIAVTNKQRVVGKMNLSYNIKAYYADFPSGEVKIPNPIISQLKRNKLIAKGDLILFIHGQHWRKPGMTNALALIRI